MAEWMGVEFTSWLLIAGAVALVLLVTWKPTHPQPRHGAGGRGGGSETMSSGTIVKTAQKLAPVSTEALAVAKRLGLNLGKKRVPVTVLVNNVVLRHAGDDWSVIEEALRVVSLLNEVACVFLIACVTSDEAEEKVKDIARSSGLVKPCGENRGTSTPDHRLLFCSTDVGQIALVRQLRVSLHIGGTVALMDSLSRFVPELIRIDPKSFGGDLDHGEASVVGDWGSRSTSSSKGADCLEWREYKSLAAAAGLPFSHTESGQAASEIAAVGQEVTLPPDVLAPLPQAGAGMTDKVDVPVASGEVEETPSVVSLSPATSATTATMQ